MKMLFAFLLLTLSLPQTQTDIQNRSGLEVLSLDVKEKVTYRDSGASMVSNRPPVLNPDPSANRGTDRNEPDIVAITRDTSQRMSDLQSVGNRKGDLPSRSKTVMTYESEAQMKNDTSKSITTFVWAYRASPTLQYTQDQEFLCNVKIGPGDTKLVRVISRYPRQRVVDISASSTNPIPEKPALTDIIVNQVKFADGRTWQRPNWNPVVLSRRGRKPASGQCIAL